MPWLVHPLVAAALAVMVVLPRLTTAVPAPRVAIVILSALTTAASLAVPTVGDEGDGRPACRSSACPTCPRPGTR